eukprot:156923_1
MCSNEVKNDCNHEESSTSSLYQLIFDIKHCIFKAGNATTLLFSIYDNTSNKRVTEEYCLHLNQNNHPKIGFPDDCKVLFKNLSYDILQRNICILCRIYRIGPMEAPDVTKTKKHMYSNKMYREMIRPYGVSIIKLKNFINNTFSIHIISGYIRIAWNTLNLNISYKHIPQLIVFIILSYFNGTSIKSVLKMGKEVMFEANTAPIYCAKDENGFNDLPFDVMQQKKNIYYINGVFVKEYTYYNPPLSIGIAYSLSLYNCDALIVKNNYKLYDKLTEIEAFKFFNIFDPMSISNIERH